MTRRFRRRGTEDGAVALEEAIVLPVFLLLFLGAVEFTTVGWIWTTMFLAVEQAGRYAMVYNAGAPSTCSQATLPLCVQAEAQAMLYALPSSSFTVALPTTTAGTGGNPSTMTVSITYTYEFLVGLGSLDLVSQVTVPLI